MLVRRSKLVWLGFVAVAFAAGPSCTAILDLGGDKNFGGASGASPSSSSAAHESTQTSSASASFSSSATTSSSGGAACEAVSGDGGDVVWAKGFRASQSTATAVAATRGACDEVLVAGFFSDVLDAAECGALSASAASSGFLAKLRASDGACLRARVIDLPALGDASSPPQVSLYSLAVDPAGDVYVGGGATLLANTMNEAPFVMKLSASLNDVVWTTVFESSAAKTMLGATIFSIALDDADDVYAAGTLATSASISYFSLPSMSGGIVPTKPRGSDNVDAFVAKLDGDGGLAWLRSAGTAANDVYLGAAARDGAHGVRVVGFASGIDVTYDEADAAQTNLINGPTAWSVDYDEDAGVLAVDLPQKGTGIASAVAHVPGVFLAGGCYGATTSTEFEGVALPAARSAAFGVIAGPDGGYQQVADNSQSAPPANGGCPNATRAVALDATNAFFGVDFDGGFPELDASGHGGEDMIVIALDADLQKTAWATQLGSAGDDALFAVASIPSRSAIAVAGQTTGTLFGANGPILDGGGSQEGFVALLAR